MIGRSESDRDFPLPAIGRCRFFRCLADGRLDKTRQRVVDIVMSVRKMSWLQQSQRHCRNQLKPYMRKEKILSLSINYLLLIEG